MKASVDKYPSLLYNAARDIWHKHGVGIENVLLLFPNRRMLLFFRKALSEIAGKPIWSPHNFTLDDWVRQTTKLVVPSDLELVLVLHQAWKEIGVQENIDSFFELGLRILEDFNTLDEHLVDKRKFFKILKSISAYDIKSLYENEPELAQLAKSLAKGDSEYSMSTIWSKLESLYHLYQIYLDEKKLAYSGLVYRRALTELSILQPDEYEAAYAIGFYKLNPCERHILEQTPNLIFVGFDFPEDIKRSLNWSIPLEKNRLKLRQKWYVHQGMDQKEIRLHACAGFQAVAQATNDILSSKSEDELNRTLIMVPDPSVLISWLCHLPEQVKSINLSMGLPVRDLPVYELLQLYLDLLLNLNTGSWIEAQHLDTLAQHFCMKDTDFKNYVQDLPKVGAYIEISQWRSKAVEPWSSLFDEVYPSNLVGKCLRFLELIFPRVEREIDQLTIQVIHRHLTSVQNVVMAGEEVDSWDLAFIYKIVRRILRSIKVPVSGEPLNGLQILGLYESAHIQAENLILLNANEQVLPSVSDRSILPYSLRKYFKLPTPAQQMEIQEYLFWSSICTSRSIDLFYLMDSSAMPGSEPSRWIQRILLGFCPQEWKISNESISWSMGQTNYAFKPISHDDEMRASFRKWLQCSQISATAINTWLSCRMRFYLQYVMGFKESLEEDGELEAAKFGNIVHDTLFSIYKPHLGKSVSGSFIGHFKENLRDKVVKQYCDHMEIPEKMAESSPHRLHLNALVKTIERLLQIDENLEHFIIKGLEQAMEVTLQIQDLDVKIYGKLDRYDQVNGQDRIVDYKTGKPKQNNYRLDIDKIWLRDGKNDAIGMQLMFYAYLFYKNNPQKRLPDLHLYFSRQSVSSVASTKVDLKENFSHELIMHDFESKLLIELEQMLSPDIEIHRTNQIKVCRHCPYRPLCHRD